MFDVGFFELLIIGIIALLVLGPERLPGAVRMVGLTIGRIKRGFADVKSQVEREIGADEIRQQLHNERVMGNLEKQAKETSPPASNVKSSRHPAVTEQEETATSAEPSGQNTDQKDVDASAATQQKPRNDG
ncbi:Sec-independent protein translocase protein TatB [Halopseudomonas salina]|uniref:Sec-independent protein translocase protein TatB n=1 Tax=Halopseudomonas salina TaxID=1323744 RepID=A0ABQ1PFE5_9GAMM|nr:Sec-independent protein translocase protein TatB [Halopseudomonas salina]GGC96252.1 sec-independent protein translocase protein TatB [Halopseudomonas salina]